MFKKTNRNFRRRQDSEAEDDEDGANTTATATTTTTSSAITAVKGLMDQKPFLPNFNVGIPQSIEDDESLSALNEKMKKKKKKKDESSATTTTTSTATTASSKLSFDDLEDADVEQPFKIKKSKESRRLERELKKEKKLEKARKKLEELDANNVKKENADSDEDAGATYIDAGDIRIKVKSFNVPTSSTTTTNSDVKPVVKKEELPEEDYDEEVDQSEQNGMKYSKPSSKTDRFAASRGDGAGLQKMLEQGKIPDAAMIHAVRKRRQQLAQEGGSGGGSSPSGVGGEDYVPLKSNSAAPSSAVSANPSARSRGGSSRLVTEEQEYDEDSMRPMKFSVNEEATQRQEIRDNFMAAEHGSDEGSDDNDDNEALKRWEREQIKKGFTGAANGGSGGGSVSPSGADSSLIGGTYYGISSDPLDIVNVAMAAASSSNGGNGYDASLLRKLGSSKCDSIGDVKKRIGSRVDAVEDVRRAHRNELESLEDSLALTEHSIHTHESDVKRLEKKYAFFQEMRSYVTDLVDCLNEKLPKIEALEASVHALWRKRAERLEKRYQMDVKDMAAQYSANAAKTFDLETRKRILDREARRTRRKQARAASSSSISHEDGLSTDEEEQASDMDSFQSERLRLVQTTSEMWSDVVEEFYKLDVIKSRFEDWKRNQGGSYQNAFISFCLPGLFAPFVRLQMIGWSPFRASSSSSSSSTSRRVEEALSSVGQGQSIENFQWFNALLMYNSDLDHLTTSLGDLQTSSAEEGGSEINGHVDSGDNDDDNEDDDDDDFKILPRVLEKVMVPKLNFFIEDVWNPMSSTQTKTVANLLHQLVDEYPTIHMDSKPVQALVKSVVLRLKRTLNEDIYMPLYSKDSVTDPNSETYGFFHRQLWSCVKLFGNMFEFSNVLGVGQIQEMAFGSLLNRYIMIGLLTMGMGKAGLVKCRAVVDRIPEKWMRKVTKVSRAESESSSSSTSTSSTYPPLENFAKHVKNSSVTYGKEKQGEGEIAFREARETIKQAAYLLCDIYAYDHAKVLSELFSFKL